MGVFGGILGFESFVEGACGWVAVAANVAPNALVDLFRLIADDKNVAEARRLYRRYAPLIEFVGGQRHVAGTKALLGDMGRNVGVPRPPRLPLPAVDDATARALVRELGLAD